MVVPTSEIMILPAPTPMPTTTSKITKAVSRVSSTTVRKRIMANAPARLKARATLLPMTSVTMLIRTVSSTSVVAKGIRSERVRRCVRIYTAATTLPNARETIKRRVSSPSEIPEPLVTESLSHSGIDRSPVRAVAHGPHKCAVLGNGARREVHGLDDFLEERRHERPVLELADHLPRQNRRTAVEMA